jgi:flagellar L-ring protein precursor FlgH
VNKSLAMKVLLSFLFLTLLLGCATSAPEPLPPIKIERTPLPSRITGSIYQNGGGAALFSDIKAARVGDILTIMLVEQTTAQNTANSSVSRNQDSTITAPGIGTRTLNDLRLGVESESEFNGAAANGQSNNLIGNIAVTVREILPGGTLLVEGEKWIQINQAQEFVKLEGIIRTRDVQPNNIVMSSQVADARITYSSKGMMASSGQPAWGSRFFTRIWPF